jgi:hypothetical protein
MPASSNVAISSSRASASAASRMGSTCTAPSPLQGVSPALRAARAQLLQRCLMSDLNGAMGCHEVAGHRSAATSAAAVAMNPSTTTTIRRAAAPSTTPTSAANLESAHRGEHLERLRGIQPSQLKRTFDHANLSPPGDSVDAGGASGDLTDWQAGDGGNDLLPMPIRRRTRRLANARIPPRGRRSAPPHPDRRPSQQSRGPIAGAESGDAGHLRGQPLPACPDCQVAW